MEITVVRDWYERNFCWSNAEMSKLGNPPSRRLCDIGTDLCKFSKVQVELLGVSTDGSRGPIGRRGKLIESLGRRGTKWNDGRSLILHRHQIQEHLQKE